MINELETKQKGKEYKNYNGTNLKKKKRQEA